MTNKILLLEEQAIIKRRRKKSGDIDVEVHSFTSGLLKYALSKNIKPIVFNGGCSGSKSEKAAFQYDDGSTIPMIATSIAEQTGVELFYLTGHPGKLHTMQKDFLYCMHPPERNCICRLPNSGIFQYAMVENDATISDTFIVCRSTRAARVAQWHSRAAIQLRGWEVEKSGTRHYHPSNSKPGYFMTVDPRRIPGILSRVLDNCIIVQRPVVSCGCKYDRETWIPKGVHAAGENSPLFHRYYYHSVVGPLEDFAAKSCVSHENYYVTADGESLAQFIT